MPKMSTGSIADIVTQFVEQLTSAIEVEALGRARDAVLSAVGGGGMVVKGPGRPAGIRRGPGRPPGRPRKKPPIQYCPVPGCNNRAAPVFGMVCGEHRNVSKVLIKKYRAQRKADKTNPKGRGKGKGNGNGKGMTGRRGRPAKSSRAGSQEAAA